MKPEDVPESLVDDAVDGWHNAPHDENGAHTVLLDDVMRHVLAAVLPAHERMVIGRVACQPPGSVVISDAEYDALTAGLDVIEHRIRAKVSAEILAARGTDSRFPSGWASTRDRDHAAAIALSVKPETTHPTKENQS